MDNNNCYLGIAVIPFTILSLYLVSGYAIYALISNDARLEWNGIPKKVAQIVYFLNMHAFATSADNEVHTT